MNINLTSSMWCAAVGAGGVRYCPATTCIDLQQYTFMNNNACICNSPILVSIATQAGDARRHFLRALVGEHLPLSSALHRVNHHLISACAQV